MGAALKLRTDFDGAMLRDLARKTKDANQARRLLALAEIYDGGRRGDAARIGGVGLQIIRDWVERFNARGPDGLINGKAPGQQCKLNDEQRRALVAIIESGPNPLIHEVVRWRLSDLRKWRQDTFGISLHETSISRELRALGYVKLTARPRHHAQDPVALEEFKKRVCNRSGKASRSSPSRHSDRNLVPGVSHWNAMDRVTMANARVGQKNKITRRWAKRGTRPSAPQDQRTSSSYIFGAICPALGKAAGLVLPTYNTEAMALHLAEISQAVAPNAHAAVLMDQAGWHTTDKLVIPENITIIPLPAKCPELNPVENIWQFMRENWLSNLVFETYDDIVDHCCTAWNKLVRMPETITSIGTREWAQEF